MALYYSCLSTAKFYPQKARFGKYFTPASMDYDYLLESYAMGAYGRKSAYLEQTIFEWLDWFKKKKGVAITLDTLADCIGEMKGPVMSALENFSSGIISWENVHIPPPIIASHGSSAQADFEKEWYLQINQNKVWASEPTVATALKYVMRLSSRPWDLTLMRNAMVAVRHAEQVCAFKFRKKSGQMDAINEPLHQPKLMVRHLE